MGRNIERKLVAHDINLPDRAVIALNLRQHFDMKPAASGAFEIAKNIQTDFCRRISKRLVRIRGHDLSGAWQDCRQEKGAKLHFSILATVVVGAPCNGPNTSWVRTLAKVMVFSREVRPPVLVVHSTS